MSAATMGGQNTVSTTLHVLVCDDEREATRLLRGLHRELNERGWLANLKGRPGSIRFGLFKEDGAERVVVAVRSYRANSVPDAESWPLGPAGAHKLIVYVDRWRLGDVHEQMGAGGIERHIMGRIGAIARRGADVQVEQRVGRPAVESLREALGLPVAAPPRAQSSPNTRPSDPVAVEPGPSEEWLTTIQAAKRLQLDRSTLDSMVARAPKDLPGAPARVGEGRQRRHLRWEAARLGEWLAAYRAWEMSRGRPPKRR